MSDEVIEELRREMGALRARVFELEGAQRAAAADPAPVARIDDARVSRRTMLGKAGAAAAVGVAGAVVAGGVIAQPAAATNGDPLRAGQYAVSTATTSLILDDNNGNQPGFAVYDLGSPFSPGAAYISAYSRNRTSGTNIPAFRGTSEKSYAFYGTSKSVPALFGTSTGSAGVQGNCTGSGPAGVIGASTSSDGVYGLANNGRGVWGKSTSGAGVHGESNTGHGVRGTSSSTYGVFASSGYIGLYAQSTGSYGVYGRSTGSSGVGAEGAEYGGSFLGGKAAIYLGPQSTVGKPTSGSHNKGELLCDKNGTLFFCTASGTPGTWKKVTLA